MKPAPGWPAGPIRALTAGLAVVVVMLVSIAPGAAQDEIPVRLRARVFRYDRATRTLDAAGEVVVTYQDVVIRADRLRVNLDTEDVRADGGVVVEVGRQQVRGAALAYNLRTRQGRIEQAAAEYTGPMVIGSVFLRARALEGRLGDRMSALEAFCTTCEGPSPLAYLTARELHLYPGDKIVGRRVSVWIAGRRMVTWPYFIVFLREARASRLLPVVGYSDVEGYYLKTFYTYAINQDHYGYARLDLMERLGVGYGLEHTYRLDQAYGTLFLYRLENKRTGGHDSRILLSHTHQLGDVRTRLYVDRLAFASSIFPVDDLFVSLDAFTRGPSAATTLYQSYVDVRAGAFSFSSYTARLQHTQQITPRLSGEVFADISRSASFLGTDDELLPRVTLRYRGADYSATLVAEARVDMDGDRFPGDVRFGVERLPDVTLALDPRNLGRSHLAYELQAGLGRFRDVRFAGVTDAVRADAALSLSGPLLDSERGTLGLRAQVRGSYYTTGDARAFVSGRVDYTRLLGRAWTAQAGVTYQDQAGRSPFAFDELLGRVAQADVTLTYRRPSLLVTGTAAYDAVLPGWRPVVVRAQFAPRSDWVVAAAASYDPAFGGLSRVEVAADVRLNPVWHVAYYGFYDGVARRLVHDRLALTRIWEDCLATSVTYRGLANELWFEAWLVALPWARGRVGVGEQGRLLFDQPWLQPRP